MTNTSYEDNFTFLRRQQLEAEGNREKLRASPATHIAQNLHSSVTSLSSEESAFLVPRPKPSPSKKISSDAVEYASSNTSQPIKR